jgi:hypothetical protein
VKNGLPRSVNLSFRDSKQEVQQNSDRQASKALTSAVLVFSLPLNKVLLLELHFSNPRRAFSVYHRVTLKVPEQYGIRAHMKL